MRDDRAVAHMTLVQTRFAGGQWEGLLEGPAEAPTLEVAHLGQRIATLRPEPSPDVPGRFRVVFPIPVERIGEGAQTFVITAEGSTEPLFRISLIAGEPLADDLRAEIALLREELDLLKRAFRRHCVETLPH